MFRCPRQSTSPSRQTNLYSITKESNLEFTFSAQGNPDPTLTLARKGLNETLTNTQAGHNETLTNVHEAVLSYKRDSLGCLDTGVYICSGQNFQGSVEHESGIGVRCEYGGVCLRSQTVER